MEAMRKTGQVQEGAGGLTFGSVKGAGDFMKQAKPGSVYVEYDVPINSLLPGGREGWVKIIGPNAAKSQKFKLGKQGGEISPKVQNISPVLRRKERKD